MLDIVNALARLVSLAKPQNAAATLTGDYKSIDEFDGEVFGECLVGAATGAPDSFTATFSLLEADDSSGTNSQAIAVQSSAVVLTSDKSAGCLRGLATKPYVAVKCVLAFVNGTSPKQDCFGVVTGAKSRVGSA